MADFSSTYKQKEQRTAIIDTLFNDGRNPERDETYLHLYMFSCVLW